MKRLMLVFSLCSLFFFIIIQYFVLYAQAQTLEGVKETIGSVIEQTPEEKQKEAVEKAGKQLEEVLEKKEIDEKKCDQEGEACCVSSFPKIPSLPDLSFIPGGKSLGKVANDRPDNTEQTKNLKIVFCANRLLPDDLNNPASCKCIKEKIELKNFCEKIANPNERAECDSCSHERGVWSALGCIDFTLLGFIKNTLLGWGIGLTGIISMFCIIYSAFVLQTSGGNPEKIKKAKERLTACIIGLLLIIFSVFILKIIGIDILKIPFFV